MCLVCVFVCLSVYLSVYLSVCLFICLSVCLFLSVCQSACLSVCPSICLSVCLCACLLVCLSVCLPACLSACLLACLFSHIYSCYLQRICSITIRVKAQHVSRPLASSCKPQRSSTGRSFPTAVDIHVRPFSPSLYCERLLLCLTRHTSHPNSLLQTKDGYNNLDRKCVLCVGLLLIMCLLRKGRAQLWQGDASEEPVERQQAGEDQSRRTGPRDTRNGL